MFGIFAFVASTAVPAGVTTYALTKINNQETTVDRGRSMQSLFRDAPKEATQEELLMMWMNQS